VVYKKIAAAPNNTQRFSLVIALLEVTIGFIVLVHLPDYLNSRSQPAVVMQQIPAMKKLFAPSLGDLVEMFTSFANIKTNTRQHYPGRHYGQSQ